MVKYSYILPYWRPSARNFFCQVLQSLRVLFVTLKFSDVAISATMNDGKKNIVSMYHGDIGDSKKFLVALDYVTFKSPVVSTYIKLDCSRR